MIKEQHYQLLSCLEIQILRFRNKKERFFYSKKVNKMILHILNKKEINLCLKKNKID